MDLHKKYKNLAIDVAYRGGPAVLLKKIGRKATVLEEDISGSENYKNYKNILLNDPDLSPLITERRPKHYKTCFDYQLTSSKKLTARLRYAMRDFLKFYREYEYSTSLKTRPPFFNYLIQRRVSEIERVTGKKLPDKWYDVNKLLED